MENIKAVLVEEDYKGSYKRYALTLDEFNERFPETVTVRGKPTEESCTDTIKPFVHIWYILAAIDSNMWKIFFTDMFWGLPEGDIKSNNKAYIDIDECNSLKEYVLSTLKTNIANISVEVYRNADGTFNTYIETECSSGAEYKHISTDKIGEYVADLIESLAENL